MKCLRVSGRAATAYQRDQNVFGMFGNRHGELMARSAYGCGRVDAANTKLLEGAGRGDATGALGGTQNTHDRAVSLCGATVTLRDVGPDGTGGVGRRGQVAMHGDRAGRRIC
ncbi:hypothetical protein KCP75_01575 [Salmonella enterica subsp. enterica]|nr:hypothetical protein KCP75_01575 [Salmonella enterica subsp. enterica]